MNKGPVAKIWKQVLELWEAFKSPETPKFIKVCIIGALIYLVSPLDIIPDVLFGVGLLDDVFIIMYAYKQLKKYVPQISDEIKKTIQIFSEKTVYKIADKGIKPACTKFVLKQWIYFAIHVLFFVISVMIIMICGIENKIALYSSSFLLFVVSFLFFVKGIFSFLAFFQVVMEYIKSYKEVSATHKKSEIFKNAVVETLIKHFYAKKQEENSNQFANNVIRFSVRRFVNSSFWTAINKKELMFVVFDVLKKQIVFYFVCYFLYFLCFVLVIRPTILFSMVKMNYFQFIFYFLNSFI